jgi:NAD(P)-dependent dehydrogenase (short-subunit alcohol dehydrogenase family)
VDLGLTDRVALVAGASEGTGRAIALAFADEGADVVVAARRAELLGEVAAEIERRGRRALAVPADLTDTAAVERVVEGAMARFGRIDVLVNSFGRSSMKPFLDLTDEDWAAALDSCLLSMVRCCRAVLPIMLAQGKGAIVNLSAQSIHNTVATLAHYTAGKAATWSVGKNLAKYHARQGIRVNTICPGMIESPALVAYFEREARARGVSREAIFHLMNAEWGHVTYADRACRPEEIAALAVFLASDVAAYVNGATVNIDGGTNF